MATRITANEIKHIFERLIQRISDDKIEFIDIETDYYWIITSDEWDNFSSTPNMIVGSLVDDWISLQRILEIEHIVTYVDYERFASILRAISEAIAPSTKEISSDKSL